MKREDLLKNAKPLPLNIEMVKAILNGRKSQFREAIKLNDNSLKFTGYIIASTNRKRNNHYSFGQNKEHDLEYVKSKYKVGDILYVKETFCFDRDGFILYKEDYVSNFFEENIPNWKPSIHLKKEDSRIFLKVTKVRVERLQDISNIDIKNEGLPLEYKGVGNCFKKGGSKWWIALWNSKAKNGYKWEDNPYVFVYDFERIECE